MSNKRRIKEKETPKPPVKAPVIREEQNEGEMNVAAYRALFNEVHAKINKLEYKTESQAALSGIIDANQITICDGPAGTGKTHTALWKALKLLTERGSKFQQIILIKPVIEAEEKLGFLPGPQPLHAKVLTPTGWQSMGNLQAGDLILNAAGKSTTIKQVVPQGKMQTFKITCADGSTTEAADTHLWLARFKYNKPTLATTLELMQAINSGISCLLPRPMAAEFQSDIVLKIPPYVLGAYLGDGSSQAKNSSPILYNKDIDLVERCQQELAPLRIELHKSGKMGYKMTGTYGSNVCSRPIRITDTTTGNTTVYKELRHAVSAIGVPSSTISQRASKQLNIDNLLYEYLPLEYTHPNIMRNLLHQYGLLGHNAHNKFIPRDYLHASIDDRVALLQGLLDTDGCIKENGEITFSTTSKQLAHDLQELIRSLGGRCKLRERDRRGATIINGTPTNCNYVSFEFNIGVPDDINPFYIERKAKRVKSRAIYPNAIVSVEPIGMQECQCIVLEDEPHLYITDDYIVTHNSLEEKLEPYIYSYVYLLEKLIGKRRVEKLMIGSETRHPVIEVKALAFLRGVNIDNAILIIDEAQNMTIKQMKTLLTRIGENCKFIMLGDIEQSDRFMTKENTGLYTAQNKLSKVKGVGTLSFKAEDIVRNPIIGEILKALE